MTKTRFAPLELQIWAKDTKTPPKTVTDEDINARYTRGEGRILIETNRERMQVFVESLRRPNYLELSPFYQRRIRWDDQRRSLLIESFIMNVPVPPVFLYEKDFGRYEVMDGQQRISTLLDFYDSKFELKGLKHWPELNGRRYNTLPAKVRAGIDRRSLSSIVLLRESATDEEDVSLLRRTVFDRLNRGGVHLARQEIRNALFAGTFNAMIHDLAENEPFSSVWNLDVNEDENSAFQRMDDLEAVLRFFALRNVAHYWSSLQDFLDLYMARMQNASPADIAILREQFLAAVTLGKSIYGEYLFRTWDPKGQKWSPRPNKGFCDCVLTGLAAHLDKGDLLRTNSAKVIEATKRLFQEHEDGIFTGRKSTRKDLEARLTYFNEMLGSI